MKYIEWAVMGLSMLGLLAMCLFAWIGFRVLYADYTKTILAWRARRHWERFEKLPKGLKEKLDE